jgi:CHAD domain-containing protein
VSARLPPDLLERSAPESARLLALGYLEAIERARIRLGDALDQEALHDFRVGIRRLRSAVRAYRAELQGSVSKKERRRLRNLARATNDGRDVEVQLDWLARQRERLVADEVPGFFWLVGRLEDRKQKTHDRAVADVARRYDKLAVKLKRSLGVLRIELGPGQGQRPASFREITAGLIREQAVRVRDDLARIGGADDAEQAHRSRISLKRMRYLVEPVARGNRRAGALVRRFKEAQDLLGEHHDMHVLSAAIGALRGSVSSSKFAGLEPGLAALARLADESAAAAFDRFQAIWGGDHGSRILTRTEEFGRELETPREPAAPQASETMPDSAKTSTRRHGGHGSESRSRGEFLGEPHTTDLSVEDPDSLGVLLNKDMGREADIESSPVSSVPPC